MNEQAWNDHTLTEDKVLWALSTILKELINNVKYSICSAKYIAGLFTTFLHLLFKALPAI